MRILNTQQVRELDAYTIEHEPIASVDLMERAARCFVEWFTARVPVTRHVDIVCGTGNNGGDGLAIARMLREWEYPVTVWIIKGAAAPSGDFTVNRERLTDAIRVHEITDEGTPITFEGCDVLIDALFGSGLSRQPAGLYALAIDQMNAASALRVAVDIPSGLMADGPSSGSIVKADHTVTFQLPKLAFLLPQSYPYTGEWEVLDIGLDRDFISRVETPYFFTRTRKVKKMLHRRERHDHKGTFGHALIVAGSRGKMGAAVLASRAALRAGVGLLTVHVPGCGYQILQATVPEAMTQSDEAEACFTALPDTGQFDAVGIGPGLGQDERSVKALGRFLESCSAPLVLDADALNILSANRHFLNRVPENSILTPHPKEFERLVGPWKDDFERLNLQKQLSATLKAVIVLKGAFTSVATPGGNVHFNSTGNPGMGTGGTGDVLTGILAAMLAQKYSPEEAAVAGVFLHGLAGDLAQAECGMESLIASDLVTHLPGAFMKTLRK